MCGERACRTRRAAFGGEPGRGSQVTPAQGGFHQREIDDVALGVAAAEPVRQSPHRPDPTYGFAIVAIAERLDGEGQRPTDLARELHIAAAAVLPAPTKAIIAWTSLKA